MEKSYQAVTDFWFEEIDSALWFRKDLEFDNLVRDRFFETYLKATKCELVGWRNEPKGRLAEIIVLDQFSRNMFRGSPRAFEYDSLAVGLAQEAVAGKLDQHLSLSERKFLYMPLMHSESLIVHEMACQVFSQPGLEENYRYELLHLEIIKRFGRYPHRNSLLGRDSTAEEIEFLAQPGSSF